jgi:regulator of replication initiation timing
MEDQEKLKIRIRETEVGITQKYETEVTRQYTIYEQNISSLNQQLEDWRRKLVSSEQANKNLGTELEELRRRLK